MSSVVIIKICLDLDPVERFERYHKPLDAALAAAQAGEVLGGGTMSDLDTGNVLYSDLQVEVTGDLDRALGIIREALVRCGAPSSTELCVEGTDRAVRIGTH